MVNDQIVNKKGLALLLDPEKADLSRLPITESCHPDYIFVGGSTGGDTTDFIAFNMVIDPKVVWDVIAQPHINEYYGEKRRQLQILDAKPSVS